jgi:AcrR family transcriptional regulator
MNRQSVPASTGLPKDSRQQLLEAARSCFLKQPYSKVSTRQIAEQANVNKALISYYFNGKQGLFEAMILDVVEPAFTKLEKAGHGQNQSLPEILTTIADVLDSNPDFPKLMTQVVFSQDHPAQEHVIERFLAPALNDFKRLLSKLIGPQATPEQIERTLISIYCLLIGPAILQPVLSRALDVPNLPNFLASQAQFNLNHLTHFISTDTKKAL